MTSKEKLIPLPTSVWLLCHPGNRPYLGKCYEDQETALHAKQNYEVVVEVRVAHSEYTELEDRYCKEGIVKNQLLADAMAEIEILKEKMAIVGIANLDLAAERDTASRAGIRVMAERDQLRAVLEEIGTGRFGDESCIRKAREALRGNKS